MTKKLLFALSTASLGLGIPALSAESPFGGLPANSQEPLQMVIDYGSGQPKHRESHHGVMEPVGLAVAQPVTITLHFLRTRAGDVVTVSPLDGGQTDLAGPVTIAGDGTVVFHFQTEPIPGLYRLMVDGPERYEIPLYGIDPNRARRSPNSSGR